MLKIESKARNLGTSVGIIIPKILCNNYGINRGDNLILIPTEEGILIRTLNIKCDEEFIEEARKKSTTN